MRIVFVLICSFALACVAAGAQKEQKENKPAPKKKQAQAGQVSQPSGKPAGKTATATKPYTTGKPAGAGKPAKAGKPAHAAKPAETGNAAAGISTGKGKGKAKPAEAGKVARAEATAGAKPTGGGKPAKGGKVTGAGKPAETATATAGKTAATGKAAASKPLKPQHFNLPKQPNTAKAPPVKFQQGRRIEGSQNWQGQQYTVFRNYRSEWHDEGWWHSHYGSNIVFMFGAPYFLNAGYWFPAWGYNPNAYYAYDGPIYAYNNLPPDQVIANVQSALQQQGYYHGEIDGLIGPLTREAVANYQRDHGLYTTSTIDRPTLESLGMS
jgi:Putative peptidoglycan binding domain